MNWEYLQQIAYCNSIEVLKLTERLCNDVVANNIPGDFAECGVAYGAHGIIMNECSRGQKVYLYDSFDGIPTHSKEDIEWTEVHGDGENDQRKSGGITVCKLENVKETMLKAIDNLDNFVFVEGWFADTFPKLTSEKFSILRLDCDLYESYKLTLRYMLPRLQKGGYLIVDDIGLSGCKKAIEEFGLKAEDFILINENTVGYLQWV